MHYYTYRDVEKYRELLAACTVILRLEGMRVFEWLWSEDSGYDGRFSPKIQSPKSPGIQPAPLCLQEEMFQYGHTRLARTQNHRGARNMQIHMNPKPP